EARAKHMVVWVSLSTFGNGDISSGFGGGNLFTQTAPPGMRPCDSVAGITSCYAAIWQRQWLKDLAAKYKDIMIVDAMQEFNGFEGDQLAWANDAKSVVAWFRSLGYTNPLELMSNYGGRDLFAIHTYGPQIAATDTVVVNGTPQTMFGWQAYWGTTDN